MLYGEYNGVKKVKKEKIAFMMLALLVLIPTVKALSVGVIPITKQRTVGEGEVASFSLGFFNLDNKPVIVEVRVKSNLKVKFPTGNKLVLQPTSVTSSTNNGRWFQLEGNKYVRMKTLKFLVQAPNVSKSTVFPLKVTVEIRPKNVASSSQLYESISQIVELNFKLNVKDTNKEECSTVPIKKVDIIPKSKFSSVKLNDNVKNFTEKKEKPLIPVSYSINSTKSSNSLTSITGKIIINGDSLYIIIFTLIGLVVVKWRSEQW